MKKLIWTYQGIPCGVQTWLIKRIIHPRLWRLHHTKVLALLSNGSRFPSNLIDLVGLFSRFGDGFRHVVGVVRISWYQSHTLLRFAYHFFSFLGSPILYCVLVKSSILSCSPCQTESLGVGSQVRQKKKKKKFRSCLDSSVCWVLGLGYSPKKKKKTNNTSNKKKKRHGKSVLVIWLKESRGSNLVTHIPDPFCQTPTRQSVLVLIWFVWFVLVLSCYLNPFLNSWLVLKELKEEYEWKKAECVRI